MENITFTWYVHFMAIWLFSGYLVYFPPVYCVKKNLATLELSNAPKTT
jgi:hypothetical protein